MSPDEIIVDEAIIPTFIEGSMWLSNINVLREGVMSNWKFTKLTMDKIGMRFLEAEVNNVSNEHDKNVEFTYQVSLVLNPENYNLSIKRLFDKAMDSQKEMGKTDADYLNDLRKIHYDYEKEANMYGIFDFKAMVIKFERKIECTKIKFIIGAECYEHLSKNFETLSRSALVLKKI